MTQSEVSFRFDIWTEQRLLRDRRLVTIKIIKCSIPPDLQKRVCVIFKRENVIWHCFAVTESYDVKAITF